MEIKFNFINNLGKLTNTYSLLNTSLNLHGFPIVNNANDLIFFLKKTKIDGFILENDFFIRP